MMRGAKHPYLLKIILQRKVLRYLFHRAWQSEVLIPLTNLTYICHDYRAGDLSDREAWKCRSA
jgi:hypothetical protein